MGLDMYLIAKKYILYSNKNNIHEKLAELFPELGNNKIEYIQTTIGNWRKANAIHGWFVENIQSGKDDCGNYSLCQEDLEKLLNIVNQVLEDKTKAPKLLPVVKGFFFGSEEYDNYYFEYLEHTRNILTKALGKDMKDWEFEYQSSW